MYYVYVIQNERSAIYVGYTRKLDQRIDSHNRGETRSTRGHQWRIVYFEAYLSEADARDREKKLKQRGQAKRFLKERIAHSLEVPFELSAR